MAKWFQRKCSPDEILLLTREALSKSVVCREIASSERTATIIHFGHCLGGGPRAQGKHRLEVVFKLASGVLLKHLGGT